ncbi:hypothetical protein [Tuwongella immobilis]|uniref:Uncharacterized protein n=1 Tax=Tuwongella immobilis TaxID=692036 RepID=A0A6C2YKS6_9BACT|nr:hypothetical protein [Tuwongella immobilis]VIP02178.1 unnamed protein product [Tuwongella immobilis]VTS00621.1 unnamed protein product [Tuwongella immobilis]
MTPKVHESVNTIAGKDLLRMFHPGMSEERLEQLNKMSEGGYGVKDPGPAGPRSLPILEGDQPKSKSASPAGTSQPSAQGGNGIVQFAPAIQTMFEQFLRLSITAARSGASGTPIPTPTPAPAPSDADAGEDPAGPQKRRYRGLARLGKALSKFGGSAAETTEPTSILNRRLIQPVMKLSSSLAKSLGRRMKKPRAFGGGAGGAGGGGGGPQSPGSAGSDESQQPQQPASARPRDLGRGQISRGANIDKNGRIITPTVHKALASPLASRAVNRLAGKAVPYVAAASALLEFGKAVRAGTKEMLEHNKALAGVSPAMAAIFASAKIQDTLRDLEKGQRLASSAGYLSRQDQNWKDVTKEIEVLTGRIGNTLMGGAQSLITEAVRPLGWISKAVNAGLDLFKSRAEREQQEADTRVMSDWLQAVADQGRRQQAADPDYFNKQIRPPGEQS